MTMQEDDVDNIEADITLDRFASDRVRIKRQVTASNQQLSIEVLSVKKESRRLERTSFKYRTPADRQAYGQACRKASRLIIGSLCSHFCSEMIEVGLRGNINIP